MVTETVVGQFDFRPNALPTYPYIPPTADGESSATVPAFVGLTPGQVGLYQLNLKLPDAFPATEACSLERGIVSNLTIDIAASTSGGLSFDGAPICVEPTD